MASIKTTDLDYSSFQNCFEKVLDKHAPMKKKYARANDGPFMNRVLRKATMLCSSLKNRYNKSRTVEHLEAFRRQRNLCVKLFRTEKRNFYKNLKTSDITDNKKFWKTLKPVLSDKSRSNSNITLINNNRMISNDKEVVEAMNDYFISITDSLGLTENREVTISTNGLSDPIEKAIMKYSKHPSIRKIRSFAQINGYFKFEEVTLEQMHSEIEGLNPKKATAFGNIPARVLKNSSDICSESLQLIFDNCIQNGVFPDLLKLADVTSLHKSEEKPSKKNYRPVSVFPTVSKVFERLMDKQIIDYMQSYLSSHLFIVIYS